MHQDIERVLISEQELAARIAELGKQVAADYADKDPIFLGILKGVVMFFSDMIRATPIQCQIDFMAVSVDLRGRHVVILEDILDSGVTLSHVCAHLREMGPASLKICTLLDKPSRRQTDVKADYVGFTIPNEFVVGYGLDYDEHYRNLPYVGILKPEVYTK